MICESVALPDPGTRAIKYPLAKRNLGRRHRRHLCHHIITAEPKIHTHRHPVRCSYTGAFSFSSGAYHLCTSDKNRGKNIIQIAKNQRFIASFRALLKQILPCAADPRVRVKYYATVCIGTYIYYIYAFSRKSQSMPGCHNFEGIP